MTVTAHPIAVIGNANLDLVGGVVDSWPDRGTETFLDHADLRVGGSAANTALVLRRLGTPSGLISAAGSDMIGGMIRAAFDGPLDRIAAIRGPSSVTFGVLHGDAERTFFSTRGHLEKAGIDVFRTGLAGWPLRGAWALVSGSFAVPGLREGMPMLLEGLRKAGARVAIDPGWPPGGWTEAERALMHDWIARCDLVLSNDKELRGLTGTDDVDAALSALTGGRAVIVAKRGAAGACSVSPEGRRQTAPARPVCALDTVGAGDAFNAGYLAACRCGTDGGVALAAGCRVASAVVAEFPRSAGPLTWQAEYCE